MLNVTGCRQGSVQQKIAFFFISIKSILFKTGSATFVLTRHILTNTPFYDTANEVFHSWPSVLQYKYYSDYQKRFFQPLLLMVQKVSKHFFVKPFKLSQSLLRRFANDEVSIVYDVPLFNGLYFFFTFNRVIRRKRAVYKSKVTCFKLAREERHWLGSFVPNCQNQQQEKEHLLQTIRRQMCLLVGLLFSHLRFTEYETRINQTYYFRFICIFSHLTTIYI